MICHGWKRRLAVVSLVFMLAGGSLSCGSPASVVEVGAPAPDFTLPTTAGSEVTLSQLRGVPVVLNLWTTWCEYCLEELGYLAVATEEKGGRVVVIAVNVGQDAAEIRQITGEGGTNFIIALDEDSKVRSTYGARYLPTTFFIDSQGIIRGEKVGAFYSREELMAELDSFLAK